ncbi:MAG: hypothetical protein JWP12_2311 [Bacteroidetes bacterium]|nr:hypothetical protein [Bacteroidota bacterium]
MENTNNEGYKNANRKALKIIIGIGAANALGMLLIGLSKWIVSEGDPLWNVFVYSDFVIVPVLMGTAWSIPVGKFTR